MNTQLLATGFRTVLLIAITGFGLLITTSCSPSGPAAEELPPAPPPPIPATPVLTRISVQPFEATLYVGQVGTFAVEGFDQYDAPMPVDAGAITWSSGGLVTTIDGGGELTAVIAGEDVVEATVTDDGTDLEDQSPIEVLPYPPAATALPIRWPLNQMHSDGSQNLLSQDFREYGDYPPAPTQYHTGLDIRGDEGAPVFAAHDGWVALVQIQTTALCEPYACSHLHGNTIILGHRSPDVDGVFYTQYSHLVRFSDDILQKVGLHFDDSGAGDWVAAPGYTGACLPDGSKDRSVCPEPGIVNVSGDATAGQEVGYVGHSGLPEPDPANGVYTVHLHFETKTTPHIGSASETLEDVEYGYTPLDPESADYNYLDPIHFLEKTTKLAPPLEVVAATDSALPSPGDPNAAAFRMGPGRYDNGERPGATGLYTNVNSASETTTLYRVVAMTEVDPDDVDTSCQLGWLQLEKADGSPLADTHESEPSGTLSEFWACRGQAAGEVWFATPIDDSPPTAPVLSEIEQLSATRVRLNWSEATDDVAVVGYGIVKNLTSLNVSIDELEFYDADVLPDMSYCYQVFAIDSIGNSSPYSNEECITVVPGGLSVELEAIIHPGVEIPNRTVGFSYIEEAVLDNGRIAFSGGIVNYGTHGLYVLESDETLTTIRDYGEGLTEYRLALDGESLYYERGATYFEFTPAGGERVILHETQEPPRPGPEDEIGRFKEFVAEGGNYAFVTTYGVFVSMNDSLDWIADSEIIPPGASRSFWASPFSDLSFDGNRLVFHGFAGAPPGHGLFEWNGGPLLSFVYDGDGGNFESTAIQGDRLVYEHQVAGAGDELEWCDSSGCTVIIDGDGNNEYGITGRIESLFIDGNRIAFHSVTGTFEQGIYVFESGDLTEVYRLSDILLGHADPARSFDLVGLEGDTLLFIVRWTSAYSDLYKATLTRN